MRDISGVVLGLTLSLALAGPVWADAVVKVTLWDKGADSVKADVAPMGMGSGGDMAMAMLGVKADVASVPAGKVTFEVTNTSKDIVHEMIVAAVPADGKVLPYLADAMNVDEDAAGALGEVSELDPGKAGSLTLDLRPGKYVLFCNIPAHFMGGMWTEITVE